MAHDRSLDDADRAHRNRNRLGEHDGRFDTRRNDRLPAQRPTGAQVMRLHVIVCTARPRPAGDTIPTITGSAGAYASAWAAAVRPLVLVAGLGHGSADRPLALVLVCPQACRACLLA
jgi:hypothetical protein